MLLFLVFLLPYLKSLLRLARLLFNQVFLQPLILILKLSAVFIKVAALVQDFRNLVQTFIPLALHHVAHRHIFTRQLLDDLVYVTEGHATELHAQHLGHELPEVVLTVHHDLLGLLDEHSQLLSHAGLYVEQTEVKLLLVLLEVKQEDDLELVQLQRR